MRLGRQLCDRKWWNLKKEYTPHEWALQIAGELVEPPEEIRADIRTAVALLKLFDYGGMASLTPQSRLEIYNKVTGYLKPKEAETVSPDEAVKRMSGA